MGRISRKEQAKSRLKEIHSLFRESCEDDDGFSESIFLVVKSFSNMLESELRVKRFDWDNL